MPASGLEQIGLEAILQDDVVRIAVAHQIGNGDALAVADGHDRPGRAGGSGVHDHHPGDPDHGDRALVGA